MLSGSRTYKTRVKNSGKLSFPSSNIQILSTLKHGIFYFLEGDMEKRRKSGKGEKTVLINPTIYYLSIYVLEMIILLGFIFAPLSNIHTHMCTHIMHDIDVTVLT